MQFKRDYYRMLIKNNPEEAVKYIAQFQGVDSATKNKKTWESKVESQEPTKKEDKEQEHKEYMKYLRAEYKKKFGKWISPRYINDEKWIIERLEE